MFEFHFSFKLFDPVQIEFTASFTEIVKWLLFWNANNFTLILYKHTLGFLLLTGQWHVSQDHHQRCADTVF